MAKLLRKKSSAKIEVNREERNLNEKVNPYFHLQTLNKRKEQIGNPKLLPRIELRKVILGQLQPPKKTREKFRETEFIQPNFDCCSKSQIR